MAHEHTHDIAPAPARSSALSTCGDCCGAGEGVATAPVEQQAQGGQRFRVPAMDCAAEESEIRRAVEGIPGLIGLRFQLGERSLRIDGEPQAALAAVEAIRSTGFEIHPWPETPASKGDGDAAAHDHDAQTGTGLPRLLAALALAIAAEGLSFFVPDAPWSKGSPRFQCNK